MLKVTLGGGAPQPSALGPVVLVILLAVLAGAGVSLVLRRLRTGRP